MSFATRRYIGNNVVTEEKWYGVLQKATNVRIHPVCSITHQPDKPLRAHTLQEFTHMQRTDVALHCTAPHYMSIHVCVRAQKIVKEKQDFERVVLTKVGSLDLHPAFAPLPEE